MGAAVLLSALALPGSNVLYLVLAVVLLAAVALIGLRNRAPSE